MVLWLLTQTQMKPTFLMIIFTLCLLRLRLICHCMPTENSYYLSHISITEEDVFNTLINLDTSKAMDPDGIPPIVLSKCASAWGIV